MSNDSHTRSDLDYAAYLFQVRTCTLEAALDELFPRASHADSKRGCRTESTDCFVFYQNNGRWAWRRVDEAETVLEASGGSFRSYLHCIADARQHGWNGKPLCLLAASDFFRCRYPNSA